ncbi:lipase 1 isoform X1 [Halyomorpha halys]|uniref:lipase 1 isoform X1 n=2 Tax=Halyomorpha halys TaxID=286706 RepID=UPI0006D51A8C
MSFIGLFLGGNNSNLNKKKLMARGGYKTTDIEVITEDGYSLWMHRLGNNTGPPIMIQHGVFYACECWITRGPKKDLVFFLLEEGYDVWLTNQRGTVYNEYSLKYKRSDPLFWDFSFHEAGMYDLPAFIDTILQIRGTQQLFYLGHSLGTTIFFVMGAMRPEYSSKIAAAILLSPTPIQPSAKDRKPFQTLIMSNYDVYLGEQILGLYEVLPRTPSFIRFLKNFCGYKSETQSWCFYLIGIYLGENRKNIDKKDFGFHMPYFSGGTSAKTVEHISQTMRSGEFQMFDYGKTSNLAIYGNEKPPHYNLSLFTAPTALFWSYNDPFITPETMKKLASRLRHLLISKPVPDPHFSHLDMYLGKNAHILLYPDILKLLKSLR